jgi:hypothetical protein
MRLEQSEHVLNERRLSRAVGPDQPEDAAPQDAERNLLQGGDGAEPPGNAVQVNDRRRQGRVGSIHRVISFKAGCMAARRCSISLSTSSQAMSIWFASANRESTRSVRILIRSRRASGEP